MPTPMYKFQRHHATCTDNIERVTSSWLEIEDLSLLWQHLSGLSAEDFRLPIYSDNPFENTSSAEECISSVLRQLAADTLQFVTVHTNTPPCPMKGLDNINRWNASFQIKLSGFSSGQIMKCSRIFGETWWYLVMRPGEQLHYQCIQTENRKYRKPLVHRFEQTLTVTEQGLSLHGDLGGELSDSHVALHLQQLHFELINIERDLLLGAQPDLRKALQLTTEETTAVDWEQLPEQVLQLAGTKLRSISEVCATAGDQRSCDDFLLIQFLGREVVKALTQTRSASALSITV